MSLVVDIQKQLGDFHLNVQLEADPQQPLALLGASGCGKSLTLRCISGILKPDSGKILLNGKTLFDSAAHINLPPQARHIGYLFQQYALFPNMTVRKNIACAVANRSKREQVTAEKLRQFHLEAVADLRPAQLSGGQQQRTALARILVSSPEVILLDEPLSALDSYLRYQLELELSETLEQFSGPVVWVSHDRGEAFRNCKQVCVLEQGHSQGITTMEALFHHPGSEAAARLSGCKNFAVAIPQGNQLFLPQWNLILPCPQLSLSEIDLVGIRAHYIHPDKDGFSCQVLRVIQDIFSTIVLLRPASAPEDAPPLRMELSKEAWSNIAGQAMVSVAIDPHGLLLLNTKGEFR